jgi:sugar lactone lactonase YvrE
MRVLSRVVLSVAAASGVVVLSARAVGAQEYQTRVVASGLARPVGIAVKGSGTIYFTLIPAPGVSGGANSVNRLSLGSGAISVLHEGEPEPTNIALGEDGALYWTCKSAGVILRRTEDGTTTKFLVGLRNDVVVDKEGTAYWTCKSAGVILKRTPAGEVSVLLRGLSQPVGIALDHKDEVLYFTEVPTPGVPASRGGRNQVSAFNLVTGARSVVDFGDPEPTDVAVARNGKVYWTCTSAGVIVEASAVRGR